MFDTASIASAHGIEQAALDAALKAASWDFSSLDHGNAAHVEFVQETVTRYAAQIAERKARQEARAVAQAATRLARMTTAARANPELACAKCDGKGRLDCFGHIEKGVCFWCNGSGLIRKRRRAA